MAGTIDLIYNAGQIAGYLDIVETASPPFTISYPIASVPPNNMLSDVELAINSTSVNNTYSVTQSDGFVTIARTAGAVTFYVRSNASNVLGTFTSIVPGTTFTSTTRQRFSFNCVAIEVSAPTPSYFDTSERVRHGRLDGATWGYGKLWDVYAIMERYTIDVAYPFVGGKVRVAPFADTTTLTSTNLDGAVSGSIQSIQWNTLQELASTSSRLVEVRMTLVGE